MALVPRAYSIIAWKKPFFFSVLEDINVIIIDTRRRRTRLSPTKSEHKCPLVEMLLSGHETSLQFAILLCTLLRWKGLRLFSYPLIGNQHHGVFPFHKRRPW